MISRRMLMLLVVGGCLWMSPNAMTAQSVIDFVPLALEFSTVAGGRQSVKIGIRNLGNTEWPSSQNQRIGVNMLGNNVAGTIIGSSGAPGTPIPLGKNGFIKLTVSGNLVHCQRVKVAIDTMVPKRQQGPSDVFENDTRVLTAFQMGNTQKCVIQAEKRLFVANSSLGSPNQGTLSILRASDGTNVATIPINSPYPHSVVVDPIRLRAYVTAKTNISVVDLTTNTVKHQIASAETLGIALIPSQNKAIVCMGNVNNYFRIIGLATNEFVGNPVNTSVQPSNPMQVSVNRAGTTAYVLSTFAGRIDVVNLTTIPNPTIVGTIVANSNNLQEAQLNFPETKLYVTDPGNNKLRIFGLSGGYPELSSVALDSYPRSLSVTTDESLAYVGVRQGTGSNRIFAVQPNNGTTTRSFGDCYNPRKSVLSSDGSTLYVTCHGDQNVFVVNTATLVTSSFAVGLNPVGIALVTIPR